MAQCSMNEQIPHDLLIVKCVSKLVNTLVVVIYLLYGPLPTSFYAIEYVPNTYFHLRHTTIFYYTKFHSP